MPWNNNTHESSIPSSAFDVEYRTQWRDEVDFLAERGIYYTIRKKEGEYSIPVYKYTKTPDLFVALADFYLRRKRNVTSKATYKGPEPKTRRPKQDSKQDSFLTKDGEIKPSYVVNEEPAVTAPAEIAENSALQKIKHGLVIDIDKIREAKSILDAATDQIGKEKLELLTNNNSEDDTE